MFLLCRNKVCKVNSEDIVFNSGTHRKKLPVTRSEEHTSELQSLRQLVCRLLLEKKNSVRLPLPAYIMPTALASPREGRRLLTSLKGQPYETRDAGDDGTTIPLGRLAHGLPRPYR